MRFIILLAAFFCAVVSFAAPTLPIGQNDGKLLSGTFAREAGLSSGISRRDAEPLADTFRRDAEPLADTFRRDAEPLADTFWRSPLGDEASPRDAASLHRL